jgi:zinc/manganese transport system permease protein
LLGFGFLVLVGATAAESSQVVGALLILGLLAAPAGAASRLTTRPFRALGLSAAIAVASVWIGLTASYAIPKMPPSFAILAVATLVYLIAVVISRVQTALSTESEATDVHLAPSRLLTGRSADA